MGKIRHGADIFCYCVCYIDDDAVHGTMEEMLLNQLDLVMEGVPGEYVHIYSDKS